jgi:Avirulence protein
VLSSRRMLTMLGTGQEHLILVPRGQHAEVWRLGQTEGAAALPAAVRASMEGQFATDIDLVNSSLAPLAQRQAAAQRLANSPWFFVRREADLPATYNPVSRALVNQAPTTPQPVSLPRQVPAVAPGSNSLRGYENLSLKDPAFAADFPGSSEAYSAWMHQHSLTHAPGVRNGDISAKELWPMLTEARATAARGLRQSDAAAFGIDRSNPPSDRSTDIATAFNWHTKYGWWRTQAMRDGNLAFSSPNSTVTRDFVELIDGKPVPLTQLTLRADGGGVINHTPASSLPKIMEQVQRLMTRALGASTEQEAMRDLAEMHWWLAQGTPNLRGSAAVSDAFVRTVATARGIELPAWNTVPDMEALTLGREAFVRQYPTMFDRPGNPSFAQRRAQQAEEMLNDVLGALRLERQDWNLLRHIVQRGDDAQALSSYAQRNQLTLAQAEQQLAQLYERTSTSNFRQLDAFANDRKLIPIFQALP